MKAYRHIYSLSRGRLARGTAGRFLIALLPGLARRVRKRPFSEPWGHFGKVIRNGFFVRAVDEEDHVLIQYFMRDYWGSPHSDEFFDHFDHRFETLFLSHHESIVDEIAKVVEGFGPAQSRVVEIGVGNGRVLEYMASKLEGVSEFHGIDINREQIETNRMKFQEDSKFSFWDEPALHWLIRHPAPSTVLFSNGGVCEYLTRDQLVELFIEVASASLPGAVALTETIAIDHDLEHEPSSYPYGHELSFSHNYPAILKEAGFNVLYCKDRFTEEGDEHHPARWVQFLAVVGTQTPKSVSIE